MTQQEEQKRTKFQTIADRIVEMNPRELGVLCEEVMARDFGTMTLTVLLQHFADRTNSPQKKAIVPGVGPTS